MRPSRSKDLWTRYYQRNDMFVKIDDIVIYASSLAKYQTKFNKYAERLRQTNLNLQPEKYEFLRKKVNYLGYR